MYNSGNAGPGRRQGNTIGRMVRDFFAGLLLFLVVFALATLDKRIAHSAPMFGPAGKITMLIESQQLLRGNGTAASLRFPLVAAPRRRHASPLHNVKFDGRAGVSGYTMPLGDRARSAITAPGPAAHSTRSWALTVMALIFAAMTTLTLGLWRNLRYALVSRRGGRRL